MKASNNRTQSNVLLVFPYSEDGEGIQLSLCDGEAQGGLQRDHHQPCIVSVTVHTLYLS